MIRTIIAVLYVVLSVIFCFPYHLYLRHIAKKAPDTSYRKARGLVRGFFGGLMWISGCKRTILGKEYIPQDEAVMFVGNHRSYFDIFACHNAVDCPLGFMSKDDMKHIPLLYKYMEDIGCTFLDRSDMKKGLETINQSAEIIKSGHSMMIFPEGTRNKGDELLPFKDGAYKIAQKAGCLIVPVAICGTDKCMEANRFHLVRRHKVVVEFLEPIDIRGLKPKERKAVLDTIPGIIQSARLKNLPMTEK